MICLTQLLCPERHCIAAAAFDEATKSEAENIEQMKLAQKAYGVHPYCGICGSHELSYETRQTQFKTLAEAFPAFKETEARNVMSRLILDAQGKTYDSHRKN